MLNVLQKERNNVDVKFDPLSETMAFGKPWRWTISR